MNYLINKPCEACHQDAPRVTEKEKVELLSQIPKWSIQNFDGVNQLIREFATNNFIDALELTKKIAELAEEAGHHPAIQTEWGKVTVRWWTHKIAGLHINDFIMASRTDLLTEPQLTQIH